MLATCSVLASAASTTLLRALETLLPHPHSHTPSGVLVMAASHEQAVLT